jgi:hypothetical protein
MKRIARATIAHRLMGLGLIALLCVDVPQANASGSAAAPAAGSSSVRPADISGSKSDEKALLPEGQKIALRGSLQAKEAGRYRFRSEDSDRSYLVLENTLLGAMVADLTAVPGKKYVITARTTVFDGANYLFITNLEPVKVIRN